MSSKSIIFILFFTISLLLGLPSCTKKEGADTPFSRLLGNWKKVEYATDDNNNGKIDPGEIFNVEASVDNELKFNSDSTGVETNTGSPAENFRWEIVDGASVLISYNANDTLVYTITEVSSADLTLTTNTKFGLAWYYYIRK